MSSFTTTTSTSSGCAASTEDITVKLTATALTDVVENTPTIPRDPTPVVLPSGVTVKMENPGMTAGTKGLAASRWADPPSAAPAPTRTAAPAAVPTEAADATTASTPKTPKAVTLPSGITVTMENPGMTAGTKGLASFRWATPPASNAAAAVPTTTTLLPTCAAAPAAPASASAPAGPPASKAPKRVLLPGGGTLMVTVLSPMAPDDKGLKASRWAK